MAFDGNGNDGPLTAINVTPLVDVVLVLLVVLMVAASGAISEALPLELPNAQSGQEQATVLRVAIAADGRLSVDGEPADLEGLRRASESALKQNPEARAAVAADGSARHERVIAVLDVLRSTGLTRLAFLVTPERP